jgi:hypothetical protein
MQDCRTMGEVQKNKIILSVIQHRQNPLEYNLKDVGQIRYFKLLQYVPTEFKLHGYLNRS